LRTLVAVEALVSGAAARPIFLPLPRAAGNDNVSEPMRTGKPAARCYECDCHPGMKIAACNRIKVAQSIRFKAPRNRAFTVRVTAG
jgi:hypothetical protein